MPFFSVLSGINLTYASRNIMIIADSAEYRILIAYNLLKYIEKVKIQQIIEELKIYEHCWKGKRKGYHIEVS